MSKQPAKPKTTDTTKKGYNEKNPGDPQGAFPPANTEHPQKKEEPKSNAAAKKSKEDEA